MSSTSGRTAPHRSGPAAGAARFRNVLVLGFSHDHTPQALRQVLDLVGPDGSAALLAVIPPAPPLQRLLTAHETTEHLESVLRRDLEDELQDWVARARRDAPDVPSTVPVDVVTGHPVAAVLQRLISDGCDLLAVTTHPDDPAANAVVKRLQRKSPCPVWAIRPSRARKRRVLAAVDTDAEHHALDHRILAAAAALTRPGDELHVATAWELVGESTLRASPFLGEEAETVDELRDRCERDHRIVLNELVEDQDIAADDVELHVVNGPATAAITELVAQHDINHLVMGTIGRTGIPGFVVGNTAEELLAEVPCSVLVVKPPGFESPFRT